MRLRVSVDGADFSDAVLVESLTIEQDSTQAVSTSQVTFVQPGGLARYDEALYDEATYGWEILEWQEIRIFDQDSGQTLFGGFVLEVQRRLDNQHLMYECSCSDYGIILERSLKTATWPNGTPDSTIATDLIVGTGITPGTIVTYVNNLGVIEAKDNKVREMLDGLCELSGSEWHVTYDGKLNYYRQGSIIAPFGLSDIPNHTTTQPYQMESFTTDFANAANRIVVLGAMNGTELTAVAQDAPSQARYGVLSGTVVNRNIADPVTAQLLADTEVAQRAWPRINVSASLYVPGLGRGQTVHVTSGKFSIDEDLILRSLTIVIAAPDRSRAVAPGHVLKYTASLGTRPPDLVYKLRRLDAQSRQPTIQPAAPIADGSITTEHFASTIAPIQIVSGLPALPSPDYRPDAVIFNKLDFKLYRRVFDTWTAVVPAQDITGMLQTEQLAPGSVISTTLADGSVVTAKIPEGAIEAPQIAASAVTANAIAANAIYSEAIQANAVTALQLAANSVVAGKIAALAVVAGNVAADAITAGTIAAAAIRAEDAVFATAAIQSADINTLNGNKIIANTITSDKLSTTELAVGGGSGSKPGVINVYDGSTSVVARVGLLTGGSYGGWFKLFGAGGTSYLDALVKTDISGNLTISNANFTVTHASSSTAVKTSPTQFESAYNSISLSVENGTLDVSKHVSRGLVNYYGSAQVCAIVRSPSSPTCGEVTVYNTGVLKIFLDGITGRCRADGGFEVSGQLGVTETFSVSGTQFKFVGGIYIGH